LLSDQGNEFIVAVNVEKKCVLIFCLDGHDFLNMHTISVIENAINSKFEVSNDDNKLKCYCVINPHDE